MRPETLREWGWDNGIPSLRLLLVQGGIFTSQSTSERTGATVVDMLPLRVFLPWQLMSMGYFLKGWECCLQRTAGCGTKQLELGLNDVGWVVVPGARRGREKNFGFGGLVS
ncbi:MAG: hypothetical protein H6668_20865 [Ardenticatenaceae bacterium]|nr:hypothetical protein [Ardenticatenaceae bacterium]